MATSSSNQLTSQMQGMLSCLKTGDRIIVEGTRAKLEVKGEFIRANLSPIVITVP